MKITSKTYARAMMLMDMYNHVADCEAIGIASEDGTSENSIKLLNNFSAILREMEIEVTIKVKCIECGAEEDRAGLSAFGCCNEKSIRVLSMSIDGKVVPSRKAHLYTK